MAGMEVTITNGEVMEDVLPNMIVWIDPGKTTGWAYYTDHHSFHSGQAEFQQLGQQLEISCSVHGTSLWLGWEDFIINERTAAMKGSEWALEIIGVARYLGQKYECTILEPCPPAGRELAGLQKLKRVGWYRAGTPHANDAAQHLLAYLLRSHSLPSDLLKKVLAGENFLQRAQDDTVGA